MSTPRPNREELCDEVLAALTRPVHAPMSDHTRDAAGHPECFSCPWPAHKLPPEDLATVLTDALLASPALARVIREAEALREAAEWVAEHVGYPVEMLMPAHPAPPEFWDAIVDHVHADATGKWHGNELSRDEVASWLDDEAGRDPRPTPKGDPRRLTRPSRPPTPTARSQHEIPTGPSHRQA